MPGRRSGKGFSMSIDSGLDFTFLDQNKKEGTLHRALIERVMEAFEALDKVMEAEPTELYKAYRTIKIGQLVTVVDEETLRKEYEKVFNEVLVRVLQEFPIGKENM